MQLVSSGLTYGQTGTRVSTGMESQNFQQQSEVPRTAQQQLLTSLSANLNQLQVDEVINADPSDFSAEKVSSRIADFVASGLAKAAARGASAERLESMYQAAVAGVQKGFAEAKAILEEMPQYLENDAVQELVVDTEAMTLAKLDELNPTVSANDGTEPVSSALTAALDYRESMKLKLVTQDGDTVEIRFNSRESYSFSSGRFGSEVETWGVDSSQRSGFQFKVVGELDADEIDAIQSLLSDVSEVADAFYAGRVDEAFELAAEVGMDGEELARMDLNLKQSSRLEVAQYEAVERQAHPEHPWAQRLQNWLEPVAALGQKAADILADEPVSLRELLLQAIDVRGEKPGFPPGLGRVLAERLG